MTTEEIIERLVYTAEKLYALEDIAISRGFVSAEENESYAANAVKDVINRLRELEARALIIPEKWEVLNIMVRTKYPDENGNIVVRCVEPDALSKLEGGEK